MKELPRICQQTTITVHPGDLGKLDKFRQDKPYLSDAWHNVFKPVRANNEGLNGRGKGHRVDLAEPKRSLAHGRTAQTILVALTICTLNLQILHDWKHTTGTTEPPPDSEGQAPLSSSLPNEPTATGRPPPSG